MIRVFSIRSGGTSALRPSPLRHRLFLVCLLLGGVSGFARGAYAAPTRDVQVAAAAGQQAEQEQPSEQEQQGQPVDSVRTLFSGTLYFSPNNGDWIERSEYATVGRFLRAAQAHPETEIRLTGWADTTGTAAAPFRKACRRRRALSGAQGHCLGTHPHRGTRGRCDASARPGTAGRDDGVRGERTVDRECGGDPT
nr:hypothetical protein [Parabacteroides bouchesdurhonensis]